MNIFCDECRKNIATVFFSKLTGSEFTRVQLCEECAQKMEETTEAANLLAALPHLIGGVQGGAEDLDGELMSGELITCGWCGTSFHDFRKMGFLGCERCYQAFAEPLEGVLYGLQGATEHVGKAPGKLSNEARLRKRLLELEHHLEQQIAEEEYEAAAAVRDQIREIRGILGGEGNEGD